MYKSINIILAKKVTQRWQKKIHDRETLFDLTPKVDDGISNANFKSFILFGKLWAEPSEQIFASLSVGLIVFKYLGISFCLISPLGTFCWACFFAWSFNFLTTSSKVQKKNIEIQLLVPALVWWPLLELNHLGKHCWFDLHSDHKGYAFVPFYIFLCFHTENVEGFKNRVINNKGFFYLWYQVIYKTITDFSQEFLD